MKFFFLVLLMSADLLAQNGSQNTGIVQGTVKDQTDGMIPGATVTLTDQQGKTTTVTTGENGVYQVRHLPPGLYSVFVTYSGLRQKGSVLLTVAPGHTATANISMAVQEQKQEVNVTEAVANQVSTDPVNNSSALVLRQEDLAALPDDPDDLQADLEALAGPSAGPGGNQIFVDGFTGGRLPPKSSLREIRINSNPFSAEFDKLGYGRIEILTKPGSDKFHGQGYYGASDSIWNSSTEHRFNLTLAVMARNILNHENLNTPNGALTSPYFLESTGITGGFGPEATASNQRRIDIQLRFSF